MKRMLRIFSLPVGVLVCLGGCTMAPNYIRPEAPVPSAWPQGPSYREATAPLPDKAAADIPWQEFFIHDNLRKVIALALEHNRDLRVAVLNIQKARAQYRITRADLLPKVDAEGAATYQRLSEDFSGAGTPLDSHQYTVGLGMTSYELDLFGRLRSLKAQALEQYLASSEAQRATRLSLVAEVASAYLTLAADRERLKLARETLESQETSYRLIRSRYQAGI